MADYAKKKNDELAALCKERGLAHTGKKADLVKRLEEHDASASSAPAAGQPAIEDEIDWDDEPATETAKAATSQPAADAIAAGGVGVEVPNPQAVPNQVAAEDPSQTNDLTVTAAPATDATMEEAKEPEKDYSTGLAERTIDEEIEKRKARARKFGMPEDTDDIKALERAKRFGTTDLPGLLNKALPTSQERKRGRDEGERDGGIRKRSRGPFRGRGRPGRGGGGGRERTPQSTTASSGSYPGWMTTADREAADRRKARFTES
jgi:SAP domain-containing ribonucleoprotein